MSNIITLLSISDIYRIIYSGGKMNKKKIIIGITVLLLCIGIASVFFKNYLDENNIAKKEHIRNDALKKMRNTPYQVK